MIYGRRRPWVAAVRRRNKWAPRPVARLAVRRPELLVAVAVWLWV